LAHAHGVGDFVERLALTFSKIYWMLVSTFALSLSRRVSLTGF